MLQKITNKKIAEILVNAGIEKAFYRNARTQLPENEGFRFQQQKNQFFNILSVYPATTYWNDDKLIELATKISAALTAAGVEHTRSNDVVHIHRA
jgi:hypothetical protein